MKECDQIISLNFKTKGRKVYFPCTKAEKSLFVSLKLNYLQTDVIHIFLKRDI